jgi:hypothetical protein
MDNSVLVAIITVSGSVIIAGLTYYLTKKHEITVKWRQEKLNHYKVLLSSLSDLAVDGTNKDEANRNLSLAVNTIALVASQDVISALMDFHNEVKSSNPDRSPKKHDELLQVLLLAIRQDIGLSGKDDKGSFDFHLIGSRSG